MTRNEHKPPCLGLLSLMLRPMRGPELRRRCNALGTSSDAPATASFLLLVAMHLLPVAMLLFLVAMPLSGSP